MCNIILYDHIVSRIILIFFSSILLLLHNITLYNHRTVVAGRYLWISSSPTSLLEVGSAGVGCPGLTS